MILNFSLPRHYETKWYHVFAEFTYLFVLQRTKMESEQQTQESLAKEEEVVYM